jgi:hypothetical protein
LSSTFNFICSTSQLCILFSILTYSHKRLWVMIVKLTVKGGLRGQVCPLIKMLEGIPAFRGIKKQFMPRIKRFFKRWGRTFDPSTPSSASAHVCRLHLTSKLCIYNACVSRIITLTKEEGRRRLSFKGADILYTLKNRKIKNYIILSDRHWPSWSLLGSKEHHWQTIYCYTVWSVYGTHAGIK